MVATPAGVANAAVGTCTVNSGAPGAVTFVNNTAAPVRVNWVGYSCSEVTYATRAAGASYSQSTYTGHLWLFRSASTNAPLTSALPVLPRSVVMAQGATASARRGP